MKSHTAIDYFLLVEHKPGKKGKKKRKKKKTQLGNGKYFSFVFFSCMTEALKIVGVSAAGAGRLLDGTVGRGTMEGSVTGSAHSTSRKIKGPPSGPALLLTADMCFSLHWISAPYNHPSNSQSRFFFAFVHIRFFSPPPRLSGRKAGKVAGRFEDTLKETSAFRTHQRRSENKLCYK